MPDAPQNPERFKPAMPRIPGVSDRPAESEGRAPRRSRAVWIAGALGALLVAAAFVWWTMRSRATPRQPAAAQSEPSARPAAASAAARENPASAPARALPAGEVDAGELRELAKPWSSKTFVIRKRLSNEPVEALVVRLPAGAANRTASYWAFSREAPFGRCELEYVTDLSKLATQYGYRAQHPMVADPCNHTVYDPLRMGTVPGGAWARGEVVQGAGLRPPVGIELRIAGQHLVATRME